MIARKLTGNAAVDAIATMAVTGNVIPATWYKTITTSSGKADLVAINILSDVLYWYRPREVRDEYTGDIIAYQKRFASDYLQRNYEQLSEHFGISKRQAKDAVVRLEELGAVKRIFRNVRGGHDGERDVHRDRPQAHCRAHLPRAKHMPGPYDEKTS